MQTPQLVVGLCQEMSVDGPARLLANQPAQVIERLLESLGRFGGPPDVAKKTARLKYVNARS